MSRKFSLESVAPWSSHKSFGSGGGNQRHAGEDEFTGIIVPKNACI